MSAYQTVITQSLARRKRLDVRPGIIEAWMRLQYHTLDHLDSRTFSREIGIALECHDADPSASERNAQSFGL